MKLDLAKLKAMGIEFDIGDFEMTFYTRGQVSDADKEAVATLAEPLKLDDWDMDEFMGRVMQAKMSAAIRSALK